MDFNKPRGFGLTSFMPLCWTLVLLVLKVIHLYFFFSHSSKGKFFLLVYVDDIIITGDNDEAILDLVKKLKSSFALKDLGSPIYFPSMEMQQIDASILLSQRKCIHDLLSKATMLSL